MSYHPTAIAIDERTHRAFVAYLDNINQYGDPNGPGAVALVDVEHGQELATLRVGDGPWTIAFDQATGTALVGKH